MPYDSKRELPENVRNVLPEDAQEIYMAAFNDAWDEYADPEDRRGDQSREQAAHQIAWSAVKQSFEKRDGEWQKSNYLINNMKGNQSCNSYNGL